MDQNGAQDSPLSIASNVAGLLTFLFAVAATAYARIRYLRSSSTEYLHIKTSLSWYKTESTWLSHLVDAQQLPHPENGGPSDTERSGSSRSSSRDSMGDSEKGTARRRTAMDRGPSSTAPPAQRAEQQMFAFVMDDLLNLERRLLDIIDEVESRAEPATTSTNTQSSSAQPAAEVGLSWSLIPGTWHGGRPSVAVAWLSVRTKALELVRQRAALTERVQFLQLSMISSRLRHLEGQVAAAAQHSNQSSSSSESMNPVQAAAGISADIRKFASREPTLIADQSLKPCIS